jgi:hypothetical protein
MGANILVLALSFSWEEEESERITLPKTEVGMLGLA